MAKNQKKAKPTAKAATADRPDPMFAANLRRLLAEKGLTARALARRMNISPQAISQWLSLQTVPTSRRMSQIADVFAVTVDSLRQHSETPRGASLRQLELRLSMDAPDDPKLDDVRSAKGLWMVPPEVIEAAADETAVAVITIRDNRLDPVLRVNDYVVADLSCRSVSAPGIYLLLAAGSPAWMHCYPLLNGKIKVSDHDLTQEVAPAELTVLGCALWLIKRSQWYDKN